MKKYLALLLVTLALVLSCKSKDESYFIDSNLPGMIYDSNNRPCEKVLITLWKINERTLSERQIIKLESDINGRFTIPGIGKGSYRVIAEKRGYETIESEVYYSTRLDVLYLKITSQKQLLILATKALNERRLGEMNEYILRSESVNGDDPYHLYVKAIYLYEMKQFESALEPLEVILEKGYRFPYVHLLLADIYQFKLLNMDRAIYFLNEYLKLIDDTEIKLRKEELENNEI